MEDEKQTKPTIETLLNRLADMEQGINTRFDALEQKFDALEQKVDGLEQKVDARFSEVDQRLNTLEVSLDRLISMASETKMEFHSMRADLRESGVLTGKR